MCIVIVKKSGVASPSKDILKNCFEANPHGAGFMFLKNGNVQIEKGFMDFKALDKAIDKRNFKKDDTVVYHFRIATAGNIDPFTCHPFPLSSDINHLREREISSSVGIAHNGIIKITPSHPDLSDTQEFIRSVMADKIICNRLEDAETRLFIEEMTTGSRLVVLANNFLHTYGHGWIEDTGLLFSNDSYKPRYLWDWDDNPEYVPKDGKKRGKQYDLVMDILEEFLYLQELNDADTSPYELMDIAYDSITGN